MPRFAVLFSLIAALLGSTAVTRAQDDPATRRAAIEAMYPIMIQALEEKAFGRARNICEQAIMWEPQNAVHHYNLACIEAQAGRLPQAFGALDLAVALGFNDPQHLQNDPDLAPLHGDPKFAEVVRKVMTNALGPGAAGIKTPSSTQARPAERAAPDDSKAAAPRPPATPPAAHAFKDGRPVGLYFMTRFWPGTGSLEKAAWYFGADGTVYQNLESGFSPESLAAHKGPRGTASAQGDKLSVKWSDGKTTASTLKRSTGGTGFSWNGGIFTAVKPFARADDAAGVYEGGESLGGTAARAAVSKRLELHRDGTFLWSGVSFATTAGSTSEVSVGGSTGASGTWKLDGVTLTLTDAAGHELRRVAFPYDDDATPVKPDWMFFGGLLYKRKP